MKLSEKDVEEVTKQMLEDHDKKVKESKYNPDNINKTINDVKNKEDNIIPFFWNWLT